LHHQRLFPKELLFPGFQRFYVRNSLKRFNPARQFRLQLPSISNIFHLINLSFGQKMPSG